MAVIILQKSCPKAEPSNRFKVVETTELFLGLCSDFIPRVFFFNQMVKLAFYKLWCSYSSEILFSPDHLDFSVRSGRKTIKQCCECAMCTWASIHSSKEKLKVIKRLNDAIFQAADHCPPPGFWLLPHFVLHMFSVGSFVLQRLDDKDLEEERKCLLFSGQNTIVSAESTWERLWQEAVSIHEGNNKGLKGARRDQSQSRFSAGQRQEGIKTWAAAGRIMSLTGSQDASGLRWVRHQKH